MEPSQSLLILMPGDDELYQAFVDAIKNGVHENIRKITDKLSGFIENAKDDIKTLISVDQQDGLQLDITIDRGNQLLASLVSKQSRLMRNALKVLLLTVGASTFTDFVHKMKKDPEDVEVTITTLTKIMTIFFADLGKKYLTKETEATIKGKISGLFA